MNHQDTSLAAFEETRRAEKQCLTMMPLKVQGLLVLAALLLFSMAPIETKVVNSTAECAEFFLQRTPPRIPGILEEGRILDQNRYKLICQTYNNSRTFVTLYDIRNKIPVFSAAKYKGHAGKKPVDPTWNFEPQLEDNYGYYEEIFSSFRYQLENNNDNMEPVAWNSSYENQAGLNDYKQHNHTFDKGHLLPSSYGHTEEEKNSTYSLTNIVPQEATFNQGSWSRMENCVRCVLDKYCIDNNNKKEAFVVIGAQPSNGRLLNNKINIPSMLWSAFCCYSSSQNRWLAGAHWGENVSEEKKNKKYLKTKTLAELYDLLGRPANVFPVTKCPLSSTVSEFYPKLKKTCECPPSDLSTTAPPTTASTKVTMTFGPRSTTSGLSTTKYSHSTTSSPFSTSTGILTTTSDSLSVSPAYHILSSQSLPPNLELFLEQFFYYSEDCRKIVCLERVNVFWKYYRGHFRYRIICK